MKKLITLIAVLSLSGCALFAPKPVPLEQQVVKQTEYVIRIPPAQLMTLPAKPADINVDTAKQSDVAAWLLKKEDYTRSLENMLTDIAKFFSTQQGQLDQAAKAQNIQLKEAAQAAQAKEAADANDKKVEATPPK